MHHIVEVDYSSGECNALDSVDGREDREDASAEVK